MGQLWKEYCNCFYDMTLLIILNSSTKNYDYHVLLLIILSNSARVILPSSGCFSSHFKNSVFISFPPMPLYLNLSALVRKERSKRLSNFQKQKLNIYLIWHLEM